jgi:hypothetical protein
MQSSRHVGLSINGLTCGRPIDTLNQSTALRPLAEREKTFLQERRDKTKQVTEDLGKYFIREAMERGHRERLCMPNDGQLRCW